MFLPARLVAIELRRNDCWKQYLQYQKCICKVEICNLRVRFLDNCKHADVIPRFLKFRIPNNGCFHEKTIHDFQLQLLKKELQKAKVELKSLQEKLDEKRCCLKAVVPRKCLPSIALYTRFVRWNTRSEQLKKHNKN